MPAPNGPLPGVTANVASWKLAGVDRDNDEHAYPNVKWRRSRCLRLRLGSTVV